MSLAPILVTIAFEKRLLDGLSLALSTNSDTVLSHAVSGVPQLPTDIGHNFVL